MFSPNDPTLMWRSLLTETLPYEVPVIFSNEILYASLAKPSSNIAVNAIVDKFRAITSKYTIPYSYQISKDDTRFTTLGVIHPNHQLAVSRFYELYKQSLIDYCSNSEASLRHPVGEMSVFSAHPLSEEAELKQGIPHIKPEDGEIDVSRMTSYFTYEKYNLLGKFIDSREFQDLEKHFRLLRTLDVSRCFFNIYTHSITWAIKGKPYAKQQTDTYSFEARFDRLMQQANYNETNGIVIGPEVSRIFAEIIFQDVDRKILRSVTGLSHGVDFAVRRYVDDFFIFASNEEALDKVTGALEAELEDFKLFINTDKTTTSTRPFVSAITLARSELSVLIGEMDTILDDVSKTDDPNRIRRLTKQLKRRALDIRLISQRYQVTFNSLSGWLLGTLRGLVRKAVTFIKTTNDDDSEQAITEMAAALIKIAFYVAALDIRVRTTYNICHLAIAVGQLKSHSEAFDQLSHIVKDELASLTLALVRRKPANIGDSVELYNLLIVGAQYFGKDFLEATGPKEALHAILNQATLTYFNFVTVKFCLLKDATAFSAQLDYLNSRTRMRLEEEIRNIGTSSEIYFLACDYLSSPDIPPADKRTLVEAAIGGRTSNLAADEAGKYLGFVDWDGARIVHVLARRELRPVYSWS